ncbi:MAG: hypothetical protein K0U24_02805 [Gammaproteobacteria bacterium]|nr:hypothetical protein [Gammaproteobacteria bacterium]MCH9716808.1 hypothetical protein [Gammaproteobacteria bacterium]MCH9763150.1 hypothetical protein [Gammaproteobacteria bacterium]
MLLTTAIMILALNATHTPPGTALAYWTPSVAPDTSLNPPDTIQSDQRNQESSALPASAGQQESGSGTVEDKAGPSDVNTGLQADPEAGDHIVLPRE